MKNKQLRFKRIRNVISAMLVLAFISLVSNSVQSSSTGKTGHTSVTSNGCGSCHGSSSSSSTTLSIASGSGSFSVAAGSTTSFTLTVSNAGQAKAGFNLGVFTTTTGSTQSGTITSGTGSQTVGGELTHTGPKVLSDGSADFAFTWTAPTTPGTYYMRAIGNAVNGNGSNDAGDDWNWMSVKEITVTAPTTIALTSPNGGESWCSGSSQNITWTSSGVTNAKIELSTNSGASFDQVLIASTPAAGGSWAWNIPGGQAAADNYRVKVSDASDSDVNDESTANFAIGGAIMITTQPQPVTICEGQFLVVVLVATGVGIEYQWQFDGVDVAGAIDPQVGAAEASVFHTGTFRCVISSPCGVDVISNEVSVFVKAKPAITGQPASQDLCSGDVLTLTVSAVGEEIEYQWMKDGQNIDGEMSATYQKSGIAAADAGSYTCLVSGECDPAITSAAAVVKIGSATAITSSPESMDICEGTEMLLEVKATGDDLEYQWKMNGNDIDGATEATFGKAEFAAEDVAIYTCLVSGLCGEDVTTSDAVIKMKPLAEITTQPKGSTVTVGQNFSFEVAADGENLMWQWFKDDMKIDGAESKKLDFMPITLDDAGFYYCEISNDCGTVTSEVAELKVNPGGSGPIISVSMTSVDFGNVALAGSDVADLTDFIVNTGDKDLMITRIVIAGTNADLFSIEAGDAPFTVKPGEKHSISIKFMPDDAGSKTAELSFESNSLNEQKVDLMGVAGLYALTSNPVLIQFGNVVVGGNATASFDLVNDGDLDINVDGYNFIGANMSEYQVVSPALPFVIAANSNQAIEVKYTPDHTGASSAFLSVGSVEHDDVDISLSGNGVTSVEDRLDISSVKLYPIPAKDQINLHIEGLESGRMTIQVVDILGTTQFASREIFISSNSYDFEWDLIGKNSSRVAAGTYLLRINLNGKIDAVTFIVE
jgi:HYDIN/CFA65/VesB family protein/Ig-like domain-containing protein/immunoglobulin I-set domain protein